MSDDRDDAATKKFQERYPDIDHVYPAHPQTGEPGKWGRRRDDHTKIERLDDE